jgi:hypothetical protein
MVRKISLASVRHYDYYAGTPMTTTSQDAKSSMNIGETIRNYRLQKGMSQGDIEKRTGLLRC